MQLLTHKKIWVLVNTTVPVFNRSLHLFRHYKVLWRKTTNPAMAMSGLGHVRKGNKVLFYPNCIIHLTRAIYLQRLPRWRRARMAWWSDIKCRQKHRKDPSEWTNGLFVRTNGNEWRREWGSSFSPPHTHITFVSSTSRELSLPVRSSLQRSSYSTQESKR